MVMVIARTTVGYGLVHESILANVDNHDLAEVC